MKECSSHTGTSSNKAENVWSGPPPSGARSARAVQATDEESSPPERRLPTGNADRSRHRTASVKSSRNAAAYSASEPSRSSRAGSSARHLVRRGQAQDVLVERDCPVFEQREEVVRHAGLVQPHRDLGEREQALDLRGKREQPVGAVVIIEGLHPEVITRAEQHLPAFVPDREGEVSQQVLRGALSPPLVGGEEQLGVGDRAGSTEHGAEVGAVVNPRVGREDERAVRARER